MRFLFGGSSRWENHFDFALPLLVAVVLLFSLLGLHCALQLLAGLTLDFMSIFLDRIYEVLVLVLAGMRRFNGLNMGQDLDVSLMFYQDYLLRLHIQNLRLCILLIFLLQLQLPVA